MKIFQINKFFFLNGGSEKYMFDLCELLERKGHEVIPFSMKDTRNYDSIYSSYFIKNLDYRKNNFNASQKAYVAIRSLYCLEAQRNLKKLIDQKKPQIAHIHNYNYHLTPSILRPLKKNGVPIIQTLHDYHIICPSHNLYNFIKMQPCEDCQGRHFYCAVKRKCIKQSSLKSLVGAIEGYLMAILRVNSNKINLFICPSDFLRSKIVENGISPHKVCHIPNFIDVAEIEPRLSNENYFVYFGRLEKFKGVLTLINAFRAIRDSKLLILGRGPLEDTIERMIEKDNLKNIELLGFKEKRALYRILRNCIATIIPSEWYENNPISVLESYAFGKPVIGSDIGGLPEMIKNEATGFLFEPGNYKELRKAIRVSLDNRSQIRDMGFEARKLIENNYTPEHHYVKVFEKYKELMC